VKIPVYLYNNPKTTGFRVSPALLRRLADMGVKGMKDSSGDALLFGDFINNVRPYHPDFNFMTGTTGMMVVSHSYGTSSTVAGTANVFPELIVKLYNLLEAKDYPAAFPMQMKVIRVRELQNVEGFRPAACYSMLKMRGHDFGTCRRPWRELTPASIEYVKKELQAIDLL
jgi:dihydrodipicolinate synthase/N-acetylneuraminate lyase